MKHIVPKFLGLVLLALLTLALLSCRAVLLPRPPRTIEEAQLRASQARNHRYFTPR